MVVVDGGNHIAAYPAVVLRTDMPARQVRPLGLLRWTKISAGPAVVRYCAFSCIRSRCGEWHAWKLYFAAWTGQRGYCQVGPGDFGTMSGAALKEADGFWKTMRRLQWHLFDRSAPPPLRELPPLDSATIPPTLIVNTHSSRSISEDSVREGQLWRELCRGQVRRGENADLTRRFSFSLTSCQQA